MSGMTAAEVQPDEISAPDHLPRNADGTLDKRSREVREWLGLEPLGDRGGNRNGWRLHRGKHTKERNAMDVVLAERKADVSALLKQGLSYREIAAEIGMSLATVRDAVRDLKDDYKAAITENMADYYAIHLRKLHEQEARLEARIEQMDATIAAAPEYEDEDGVLHPMVDEKWVSTYDRLEGRLLAVRAELAKLKGLYAPDVHLRINRNEEVKAGVIIIGGENEHDFTASIAAAAFGTPAPDEVIDVEEAK